MRADLASLEAAIGYSFANRDLLDRALTHSSHANERGGPADQEPPRDNEQLEFLGDSVLGFVVSEALLRLYPRYSEGSLSKMKARMVRATWLFEVARRLDLGSYLQLGSGEEKSGGRAKRALQEDSLEAVIAAIYLDSGLEAARQFILRHIVEPFRAEAEIATDLVDYKSALVDLARQRRLPPPRFVIAREEGPPHSRIFTVEVRLGPQITARAEGHTKKGASQSAAREVYLRLTAADPTGPPS